jgi:predicted metal-binding membrane protein
MTTSRSLAGSEATALERVLRRDRVILVAALAMVVAIAWVWIVVGAGTGMSTIGMTHRSGMPQGTSMIMEPAVWNLGYAGLMFAMWWVMMVAMMLPSATPMLLLFARVNRQQRARERPYVPTGVFAAGYLLAWGGFSVLATALQWALEQAGLLSPMMVTTSYWLGGGILLAAGLWQLTPIKGVCLRHCRSPLGFLMQGWRPGRVGALRMGLEHGTFCLGCCWCLMGLLFFGGIMNLFWIAGLAGFVLLEKTIPLGPWFGRAAGLAAAAGGVWMLVEAAGA